MTDFLTRISRSALGLTPTVQVLGASRYAPGRPVPDAGVFDREEREVDAEAPRAAQASPNPATRFETTPSVSPRPAQSAASRERLVNDQAIGTTVPPPPTSEREERVAAQPNRESVAPVATPVSRRDHARAEGAWPPHDGNESPTIEGPLGSDSGVPRPASAVKAAHERDAIDAVDNPTRIARDVASLANRVGRSGAQGALEYAPPPAPANEPEDRPAHPAGEMIELASSSRRTGRAPIPAPLPDFRETPAAQPPIVRVTIGRIDVRAAAPPAPPPAPPSAPGPRLSLDDYLRQHSGRSR